MPEEIVIMNQTETAAYISEHFRPMDGPALSRLTALGKGPKHEKKGNQKIFLRRNVDVWIEKEKEKEKARTEDPKTDDYRGL